MQVQSQIYYVNQNNKKKKLDEIIIKANLHRETHSYNNKSC